VLGAWCSWPRSARSATSSPAAVIGAWRSRPWSVRFPRSSPATVSGPLATVEPGRGARRLVQLAAVGALGDVEPGRRDRRGRAHARSAAWSANSSSLASAAARTSGRRTLASIFRAAVMLRVVASATAAHP
jgi:hypothetical protein